MLAYLRQVRTTEKEREIERLEGKVGQLEHVRERQAMKITDLEDEAHSRVRQLDRQDEAVATRIAILTDEVRNLRQALEETSRRERQVRTAASDASSACSLFVSVVTCSVSSVLLVIYRWYRPYVGWSAVMQ